MRRWGLNHGKDGYGLSLESGPWWAFAGDMIVDRTCKYTGHLLCGGSKIYAWDALWNRDFKGNRFDLDSDESVFDSIGGQMWTKGQAALQYFCKFIDQHGRMVTLTNEQAETLDKNGYDALQFLEADDDDKEVTDV